MFSPNDPPNPRWRELLQGPSSQNKLEALSRVFGELMQDSAALLPYFVLHHVCRRLAAALDGQAVTPAQFNELLDGMAEKISLILTRLDGNQPVNGELEDLVSQLIRNLAMFGP